MAAKPRISVTLSETEYAELTVISEKHRVSLAWLSRQAVIEFLERYRADDQQLPLRLPTGHVGRTATR